MTLTLKVNGQLEHVVRWAKEQAEAGGYTVLELVGIEEVGTNQWKVIARCAPTQKGPYKRNGNSGGPK